MAKLIVSSSSGMCVAAMSGSGGAFSAAPI
jgi:hypothetical protein